MKAILILIGALVVVGLVSEPVAAHTKFGVDLNLDGDCDDFGEQQSVPGPHEELGCQPWTGP